MPASLDAALSGMLEQQRNIELIANNIANVNTTGYKRTLVHFQDVLDSAQILAAVNGDLPAAEATTSSGVQLGAVERAFTQGPLLPSPDPLDLAIVGPGFFRLALPNGAMATLDPTGSGSIASVAGAPDSPTAGVYTITSTAAGSVTVTFTPDDGSASTTTSATVAAGEANTTLTPGVTVTFADPLVAGTDSVTIAAAAYARDGAFRLDANRQLVTQLGTPVEPPVFFPEIFDAVRVRFDGTIVVRRPFTEAELAALPPGEPTDGVEEEIGRMQLTRFDNPAALISIGNSLYAATAGALPANGFPGENGMGEVSTGFLEGSNVDVAQELTSLLVASRAYQMNLSAYRAIQEMLEQAAELA